VVRGPMATAYLEWCAPPPKLACQAGDQCTHAKTAEGCGCDDPVLWQRANPTSGLERLTSGRWLPVMGTDYIRAERRAMPVTEFPRERMGWHDKPAEGASPMPMTAWYSCADKQSAPAVSSPLALAIAVAPDKSMAAIGLAGWRDDSLPHGELVEHLPGVGWLLDRLLGIVDRQNPVCVVLDPAGPSGGFEKLLRARGFVTAPKDTPEPPRLMPGQRLLMITSSRDYAQGCGMLVNAVLEDEFRHPDQKPLNDAARHGRGRNVAQAWVWDSPQGRDITPLVAVTLAHVGLATYGAKQAVAPFFLT
jgi:hypothetical protein